MSSAEPAAPAPLSRRRAAAVLAGAPLPITAAASPAHAGDQGTPPATTRWSRLPDLPANRSRWHPAIPVGAPYWRQLGLAGMAAGVHGDHLLALGGANFPEPARTANRANTLGKVYWNEVFVLRREPDGGLRWLDTVHQLPDSVAYAGTVSTPRGLLVIGGEGFPGGPGGSALATVRRFDTVQLLRYLPERDALERELLPPLPQPVSYPATGLVGSTVYVAADGDCHTLDLTRPHAGWRTLPPWPGPPRTVAVGAALDGRFLLLSGRSSGPDGWRFHRDGYAWDPGRRRWQRLPDLPWCVTAGAALATGPNRLLVVGGDRDLARWNLIQQRTVLRDREPAGSPGWHAQNDVVTWLHDHHEGFNAELLGYDARRGRWHHAGWFPGPVPVTTPAVGWDGELFLVSGEVRPGIRTPAVWRGRPGR